MSSFRSKPVALKVTPEVHSFLSSEAERRGVSISALCAMILGEWKSTIEDRRTLHQDQAQSMQRAMVTAMGPLLQGILEDSEDD